MARFFSGARNNSGKGVSSTTKLLRDELRKKGRITPETYKKIIQQKLNEAKAKAGSRENSSFNMFGKMAQNKREHSVKAQKTIQFMAEEALMKAAAKLRKEVIIEVRRFFNGNIDKKGKIYDVAGNIVAQVNLKNGFITTVYGQNLGVYKPKSYLTVAAITDAINKNSPFLINQRKTIEMQKNAQPVAQLDVWSRTPTDVWGNAKTDVWGRTATDIWGRTQTDAWGNQQIDSRGNQI